MRVVGSAIQKAEEARRELAILLINKGVKYPPQLPDYSTKAKAQAVAGMNMEKLNADKQDFLKTTAVEWDKKAKERQGTLQEYKN